MNGKLAINGNKPAIKEGSLAPELFKWPIVTDEDKQALLEVTEQNKMSGTDITKKFEREYSDWIGSKFALGYCNGTAALHASMWACGVGAGDEVICPSITYWASCAAALNLGAAVNFADIDPETLCIDPDDIEHRIGPRTKVIIVVHYAGYPADMDRIMEIAAKHNVKVLEDASHSHGSLYKGRHTGTLGDIAAMSMMSLKAFPIGEAGMMTTADQHLYERCIAYGHYERSGVTTNANAADCCLTEPELLHFAGIPLGGRKDRMNQWCSAMGRVQLKYYPQRIAEIDKAMTYFSDQIDRIDGLRVHRPSADSRLTKGGWYFPLCHYDSSKFGGIPATRFIEALKAETNLPLMAGANAPLHLHPFFHEADIFHMGKPTMISFGQRDVRQGPGSLPVSENLSHKIIRLPKFVKFDKEAIDQIVFAFTKVAENHSEL